MMKLVNALHSVFSRGLPFLSRCCCCSLSELLKVFTWDFSRCYFFTLAFISLFSAKSLHLYAHLHSLPAPKFLVWGITFFFQDVIILLFFRIFAQKISWRLVSAIFALIVVPFRYVQVFMHLMANRITNVNCSLLMSGMASANISFYAVTGAEIHWAQAKSFNGDAAAIRTLLTGLTGFLIVEAILLVATWFAAIPVHRMTGGILHVWAWPFRWLLARFWPWLGPFIQRLQSRIRNQPLPDPQVYEQINIDEYDDDKSENGRESVDLLDAERAESSPSSSSPSSPENRRTDTALRRTLILGPFCLFLLLRYLRPYDPVYMFLSSTLPAAPFLVGGDRQSPVDLTGLPGNYTFLEGRTALLPPPQWDWLPKQPLPGFEDWAVSDGRHYDARADPLHISNLQNPLLHSIERAMLHNVKIKHVVLLKLESTRGDVFPLRKDSFMWNRIAETYRDKQIPNEVRDRIANLTRTAEYLTNFPTGFEHNDNVFAGRKAYGGISARNAVTSGTYTLKSLVGTLCGVSPLVADFNSEYKHHIYQPCLSHVFNAINHQSDITNQTDDFTAWPWHAAWMQSVTDSYDNQDQLTPALGYHDVLTKEVIESPNATHYPVKSEEVNYYGYPDTELREYIRDAIDNAERNHTRLFLTHLTGTTHHPWGVPNNAFEQIMGPSSWSAHDEDLNRYLNTIGFVDKWLAEIIGILEEKGVINETLFVMAGDQ